MCARFIQFHDEVKDELCLINADHITSICTCEHPNTSPNYFGHSSIKISTDTKRLDSAVLYTEYYYGNFFVIDEAETALKELGEMLGAVAVPKKPDAKK